ncbi:peptidoglycan-binding protein [Micrococcales bacterium 31B]|nr:peptidoglycan-binding protein [Micrococcales bacterium 31B]
MSSPTILKRNDASSSPLRATTLGERLRRPAAMTAAAVAAVAVTGAGAGAALAAPSDLSAELTGELTAGSNSALKATAPVLIAQPSVAAATYDLGTTTLKLGARGAAVTALQRALATQGQRVSADGVFGPATDRAVRAFQSRAGLTADGLVGPATKAALGAAPAASAPTATAAPTAPTATASGLGTATLAEGAHNAHVSTLQSLLNAHGARLRVDGRFGPGTKAAVVAFQRSQSLTADGRVGPATKAALLRSATPAAQPAPPATQPVANPAPAEDSGLLKVGAQGPAVVTLQTQLNQFGANLSVDGDFGTATLNAVKNFQAANGLTADGVVGLATQAKLEDASSKQITRPAPPSADAKRQEILTIARSLLGIYYVWGGTTPAGFDCSGYTQYVYRAAGITIPRTSDQQVAAGRVIPRSEAKPGDLVASGVPGNWHHIGIYAGGNMIIDSGKPGIPTQERALWTTNVIFVTYL